MEIYSTNSLAGIFQLLSLNIGARLDAARMVKGIRFNEQTLTQELVYSFYQFASSRKFPIKILESKREKFNGNDLEIFVETPKGFIGFPCQAKVMNAKGKYSKLKYTSNGSLQIDRLINYARRIKGYPIYLFYNYVPEISDSLEFGCTVGAAQVIRKSMLNHDLPAAPTFNDLHPLICKPFYHLADAITPKFSKPRIRKLFSELDLNKIKYYNRSEMFEDDQWSDLVASGGLGFVEESLSTRVLLKELTDNEFNAGYRIVLCKNNPYRRPIVVLT